MGGERHEGRRIRVAVEQPVLRGNQAVADRNRAEFQRHALLVLNVMSSPGAGKTTLLETWVRQMQGRLHIGVIEGDVATTLDAERMAASGVEAVQINTNGACHLDANMVSRVLSHFALDRLDCLVIENVGNLVCPADFDLGETLRVTLLSVTEGADKPVKYPAIFRYSDAVLLTKVDLLPYLPFDLEQCRASLRDLNPTVPVFEVSALSGEGMERWSQWVLGRLQLARAQQ